MNIDELTFTVKAEWCAFMMKSRNEVSIAANNY